MSLCFMKNRVTLQGFIDANLGGDMDKEKNILDYVFILGGNAARWISRLQKCVFLSTIKVEYVCDIPEFGPR